MESLWLTEQQIQNILTCHDVLQLVVRLVDQHILNKSKWWS